MYRKKFLYKESNARPSMVTKDTTESERHKVYFYFLLTEVLPHLVRSRTKLLLLTIIFLIIVLSFYLLSFVKRINRNTQCLLENSLRPTPTKYYYCLTLVVTHVSPKALQWRTPYQLEAQQPETQQPIKITKQKIIS